MITPEMLCYLLQHCVDKGWLTPDQKLGYSRIYNHSIDIYQLECIIDIDLMIMSAGEAIEIIEREFTLD